MVADYLLFHLFPNFAPLTHRPKSIKLNNIKISTRKSSLSEVDFSQICINTLGNILLETMADSTVYFTTITNIISSNPSPHMVVSFLLNPLHWQNNYQDRERKIKKTEIRKFQPKRRKKYWMLPQISSNIHCLLITRFVEHDSKCSKISTIW